MSGSLLRVRQAFAHEAPDRTPLFEIFVPFHPIHWPICGRTVGTDEAMRWDAMADGIAWEELIEADAQAAFRVAGFFGLDMVRLSRAAPRDYPRPLRLAPGRWLRNGVEYLLNQRTQLVELADPAASGADSQRVTERSVRDEIEAWDGTVTPQPEPDPVYRRVRELAAAAGIEWVYMNEYGGVGAGAAFYPPFMLMWMLTEPQLYTRWLNMRKAEGFQRTREALAQGYPVIVVGGDVSCDKGPFISPALYRQYLLPVIQEQVRIIHDGGALAVYTSDGNHWAIKEDLFFNTGVDGYKEVDKAAGMTFERLIAEGIDRRVCIIGNIDARYTLCLGTPAEVRAEVFECLRLGQQSPGGHILHASHSVHDDVKPANYFAMVNAYREYFGLERLPG